MDPKIVEILIENHRRFLAFLVPKLGSEDVAEEVLQEAFVRGLEKGESIRSEERIVAWFFRLLRNSVTDHYRRRTTERRALEQKGNELESLSASGAELEATVCACVMELATTLKPEYATILRAVDLESKPVKEFANEQGLSANNASVRLHRARQALARQLVEACGTCCKHGCVDCECLSK